MPLTITATISDSSGASAIVTATALQGAAGDGSAGAPPGTIQFPALLDAYAAAPRVRPPWNVAGVQYHVGIDRSKFATNANLKNPASISMPGVSVSGHQVVVSAANVVLDGYDFSLNGGWGIFCTGSNLTVSNSNFLIGANLQLPIRQDGAGLTVLNCELDGNHQQNGGGNFTHIQLGGSGPLVVHYSLFQRGFSDFIDCQTGGSIDLRWNVFKDLGDINAHPDVLQIEGGTYGPTTIQYNLCYWTASGTYGPQGYFLTQSTGISLLDVEISFNTIISQATDPNAAMAPCIDVEMTHLASGHTVRIHDNYCDPTNVLDNWAFADNEGSGPGAWNYPVGKVWNSHNMLDGTIDQGKFAGTGP